MQKKGEKREVDVKTMPEGKRMFWYYVIRDPFRTCQIMILAVSAIGLITIQFGWGMEVHLLNMLLTILMLVLVFFTIGMPLGEKIFGMHIDGIKRVPVASILIPVAVWTVFWWKYPENIVWWGVIVLHVIEGVLAGMFFIWMLREMKVMLEAFRKYDEECAERRVNDERSDEEMD